MYRYGCKHTQRYPSDKVFHVVRLVTMSTVCHNSHPSISATTRLEAMTAAPWLVGRLEREDRVFVCPEWGALFLQTKMNAQQWLAGCQPYKSETGMRSTIALIYTTKWSGDNHCTELGPVRFAHVVTSLSVWSWQLHSHIYFVGES